MEFAGGTYSDILELARQQNKIIMIDFVTDWCKWCVETDRKVYTDPSVYEFANANQINWKIDAEKGEGPELAKKYGVKGFPTIIFTEPDGSEIDRIYGYLPADRFLTAMKDYHAGVNTFGSLKKAVEEQPDSPEANYKFADKIISNGLEGDSKQYLEKVVMLDPSNEKGYTDDAKFALAYLNENADELSKALKEYPGSDKAKDGYMNLASFYAGSSDFAKADQIYQDAFRMFGNSDFDLRQGYGLMLLSQAYATIKDEKSTKASRQDAIKVLNSSLPYVGGTVNEASAYYMMSELSLMNKDYVSANKFIDKAIGIYDKKSYRDQKEKIGNQMKSREKKKK